MNKRELVLEAKRIGIPDGMITHNMKDAQMRFWMNWWRNYGKAKRRCWSKNQT